MSMERKTIGLLADENFHGHIVRGLFRRFPRADLVRVQDVGLSGRSDPEILDWAAGEGRVVLTHDVRTIPGFALRRIQAGLPMPGVFFVNRPFSTADIVNELVVRIECSRVGEYEGMLLYLPAL
jgi:hypothetical protein